MEVSLINLTFSFTINLKFFFSIPVNIGVPLLNHLTGYTTAWTP